MTSLAEELQGYRSASVARGGDVVLTLSTSQLDAILSCLSHPAQGWREKIEEIRRQLAINVDIAKRDHPEGPIVDGKRIQGMLHSQEILAGHITDKLNELEAMLPSSPAGGSGNA